MERAVGLDSVGDATGYSVDGLRPKVVVLPGDTGQFSGAMAAAFEGGFAVAPWGGGTRIELGNPISRLDVIVDLSRLNRVIQHNPADLTATVEAGVTLSSLQKTLAEHGQFLALDPPLPDRASVGGALAVGTGGPLGWQFGHPRDLVIGMKVVQADGKVVKSGGQVVKNVSGYDMSRLHIGGLGTLGVIAEVSFKLTPLPRHQATLLAAFDSSQLSLAAGLSISHSHVMPLALTSFDNRFRERANFSASLEGNHFLAVRLGGRPRTLERQVRECILLCLEHGATAVEPLDDTDAGDVWRRVADFGWDKNTTPVITGRASLLPSKITGVIGELEQTAHADGLRPAIAAHPGYGAVSVHWFGDGDEQMEHTVGNILQEARDAVHRGGGRLIIERCPSPVKTAFDVWDDVGEPLATMRRMKEQYDPKGILNPGRFAGGI